MKMQVKNLMKVSGKNTVEVLFCYPNKGTYTYVGMMDFEKFRKEFAIAYIYSMCDSLPDVLTIFIGVYDLDYRSEILNGGQNIQWKLLKDHIQQKPAKL